jgi:hypothetical protein
MKAFLVIILLCGQPTYIMGNGVSGPLAGPVEWIMTNEDALMQLKLLSEEDPIVHKQEWADVIGAQCS